MENLLYGILVRTADIILENMIEYLINRLEVISVANVSINEYGTLVWSRNKESGSYSSITGRWVISRDKNQWALDDKETGEVHYDNSLKACQSFAESIFIREEKARRDEKIRNMKNHETENLISGFQKVEVVKL